MELFVWGRQVHKEKSEWRPSLSREMGAECWVQEFAS